MIRKLLLGLAFLAVGASAHAQAMLCNYNGNYPWTSTNTASPADCINNFLYSQSKYMVAIGHAPPYCSPFFDHTPGKLLWSNNGDQGIWSLYVNAFIGPDVLDRPICVSTSRQYPMGQTIDSYSTEPPLPNWIDGASTSPFPGASEANVAANFPLPATNPTSTLNSMNATFEAGYTTATVKISSVDVVSDTPSGNGGNAYLNMQSLNSEEIDDQNGVKCGNTGSLCSVSWNCNDQTLSGDNLYGCTATLTGMTAGNLYTAKVTSYGYATGPTNASSQAPVQILWQEP